MGVVSGVRKGGRADSPACSGLPGRLPESGKEGVKVTAPPFGGDDL